MQTGKESVRASMVILQKERSVKHEIKEELEKAVRRFIEGLIRLREVPAYDTASRKSMRLLIGGALR